MDRLIDGEQDDSYFGREIRGWRDQAKRKKDSWTWTIECGDCQGEKGINRVKDNRKKCQKVKKVYEKDY